METAAGFLYELFSSPKTSLYLYFAIVIMHASQLFANNGKMNLGPLFISLLWPLWVPVIIYQGYINRRNVVQFVEHLSRDRDD